MSILLDMCMLLGIVLSFSKSTTILLFPFVLPANDITYGGVYMIVFVVQI